VRVGPFVKYRAGNFMNQDRDTLYGEATDDQFLGAFVIGGLQVSSFTPSTPLLSLPGLSEITLTFNMSVNVGSFTRDDLTMIGPGGAIPTTSLTLTDLTLGNTNLHDVWRVTFPEQIRPGQYVLTVGPDVTDTATRDANGNVITGNKMNQDGDGLYGETTDAFSTASSNGIFIEGLRVLSATPNATISVVGTSFLDVRFNTTAVGFDAGDVTLVGPEGPVPIGGVISLGSPRQDLWRIVFPTQQTIGTYQLKIGPDVFDVGGNRMDQNHDRVFGNPNGTDVFQTTFTIVPQVLANGPATFDIGGLISILPGKARRRKNRPNRWLVPLRIFNASKATILGPFAIAVDGLPRRARLISSTGRTIFVARLGRALQSTLLNIDRLGAFEGLDLTLEIQLPTARKLPRFDLQLLVGGPF
jgi:hypothetical protein